MAAHHDALTQLERTALIQLQNVDLMTPMQQICLGLEALIDVPTTARAASSSFSDQAAAVLKVLNDDVERLCDAVNALSGHVNRTSGLSRARQEAACLLSAVADAP